MDIPIARHSSGRLFYVLAGGLAVVSAVCGYASSQGGSTLAMVVGAGLPGILALACIYMGWSVDHLAVDVSDQGLVIRGPIYGRTIKKDTLKLDEAKMVGIGGADGGIRLATRSNGLGLAKLKFGWFKLNNGERAFVLVGDAEQAIYIPTIEGYPLLMTLSDREGFLNALKAT